MYRLYPTPAPRFGFPARLVLTTALVLSAGLVAAQTSGRAAEGASRPASAPAVAALTAAAAPIATPGAPPAGVELSIRFYDKRIYYPESEIALKVTIANRSTATYRFKLAEDRLYSLAFDARTPTNRVVDAADEYKRALATTKPVFYREIAVEPGEEYSFVERLERYVRIEGPGSLTLRANFWPELSPIRNGAPLDSSPTLASNSLILTLRPSPNLPPASETIRPETGEVLKPEPVAPDEVVKRTILARQRSRWSEYFLYLDFEALLSRDEDRRQAYNRESDEGRERLLERYRADLRANVVDEDISVLPESFEILETRYTANSGFVRVLEKFAYSRFMMRKEYTYELKRRDDIWYIVGYTVENKGTE